MFHLHIAGIEAGRYWEFPNHRKKEKELMGIWFNQLKLDIRLALVFV